MHSRCVRLGGSGRIRFRPGPGSRHTSREMKTAPSCDSFPRRTTVAGVVHTVGGSGNGSPSLTLLQHVNAYGGGPKNSRIHTRLGWGNKRARSNTPGLFLGVI